MKKLNQVEKAKKYIIELVPKNNTNNDLSINDLSFFIKAKTLEDKIKLIVIHSKQNQKNIEEKRRMMKMNENEQFEKEAKDVNDQFIEFLKTKGIKAKFNLAFENMKESAKAQHEIDKANFQAVKKQSAEDNKEFVEFLHTKGLKAKFKLVIENIKKGAKESKEKTKQQIAEAKKLSKPAIYNNQLSYDAESLSREFNEFLKQKGLDNKYTVIIKEEEE